jgi:RHS repeat-associated protein
VDYVQWSGQAPQPQTWTEIEYVYDAFGRRIAKSYDGATVLKYLYDGDHCIAEYDASDNLARKYIFGPCVDEPICMIEAAGSYAGTYYYHFDALGSVVALTNSSGNTVEVYEYDVYGRVGASDPNHPNRFLFTGREFDKETGLYYYRARYYNPQIGRFLQTDPVGYGAGMNLYAYCGNNPTNRLDPTGNASFQMSEVTEGDGAGTSIRFTVYADDGVTVIRHYDACDIDAGLRWLRDLDDIFTDEWLSTQDGIKMAGDELTWWYLQAINQLGGGFDLKAMEQAGYHILRRLVPLKQEETGLDPRSKTIYWSAEGVSWPWWRAKENWESMRDGAVAYLAHELQHAADQMAGCNFSGSEEIRFSNAWYSHQNAIRTQNIVAMNIIDLAPTAYHIGERHWYGFKWKKTDYLRPGLFSIDEVPSLPWKE